MRIGQLVKKEYITRCHSDIFNLIKLFSFFFNCNKFLAQKCDSYSKRDKIITQLKVISFALPFGVRFVV